MRLSNGDGQWSEWEPCVSSKTWNLQGGDGTKTVSVQYMDNAGLISPVIQRHSYSSNDTSFPTKLSINAIHNQLQLLHQPQLSATSTPTATPTVSPTVQPSTVPCYSRIKHPNGSDPDCISNPCRRSYIQKKHMNEYHIVCFKR